MFRTSHWGWDACALCAIVAVGAVDYVTGSVLTFSVFYLVPVAAVAWRSGMAMAISSSVLAALVWLVAEAASSRVDTSLFVYTWNFCTRLLFLMLVAVLLARLRAMLLRERQLSRRDGLTGLLNARAFREAAEVELSRSRRYGQPLSLAFADVDGFKRINDSRGHGEGDRLLKCIADAVAASLRSSDLVARYGGDEFVVLLSATDADAARAVTEKLRASVRAAMRDNDWRVSLSFGVVSVAPQDATATVDGILERADRLMYESKHAGPDGARYARWSDD